jgi:Putative auto-transporter adhesin, head GIN domain
VELAGSGDLDAARLDAGAVAVSIVGSGNASVNARSALSVSIAGSGDVIQRGAAVPRTSIAGSGSVRRR